MTSLATQRTSLIAALIESIGNVIATKPQPIKSRFSKSFDRTPLENVFSEHSQRGALNCVKETTSRVPPRDFPNLHRRTTDDGGSHGVLLFLEPLSEFK